MSVARLHNPFHTALDKRTLFLGLLTSTLLVLVPVSPALALESSVFGDVEVPRGNLSTESYTVFGDVTVDGVVHGDVRCAFGEVRVRGPVEGDVQAGFGDVYVNAPVTGSVEVGRGSVRLGPQARVVGDVSLGNGRYAIDPGAVVAGERSSGMSSGSPLAGGGLALANMTLWLLTTLGFCAAAMLFAVIARRPLTASARRLRRSPGRSILWGVASLPVTAIASALLAATVVGAPLLLLSIPAYLALALFGALVSAYSIGRRIVLATGRHRGGEALASAVGAFAISVIYLVPVVGGIALFLLALLGVGAAIIAAFEHFIPGARGTDDYSYYTPESHRGVGL